MNLSVRYHPFFLFCFLIFSSSLYGQFTNSRTCIGGTGDEVVYPRYLGEKSSLYNFKSNDGGSIYFFYSNSSDGDFTSNKGYNDLYALKINTDGHIAFIINLGNSFYEDDFIVKQSSDSNRYYIMLESHSNDSVQTNGYIGDVEIQYSLFCINNSGTILWNKTIYDAVNHIDNYSFSNYPNWFNLFTDRSGNCIVLFNKIGISTDGRSYYNDSITYTKIDKNGHTVWENTLSPYVLYNNTDPTFQMDTFYIGSTTFQNNFTETDNKYILSTSLSRFYPFQSRNLIYTLDKTSATISSVLVDSSYSFNFVGIRDQFITYGNYVKYVNDSSNRYSFFHIRKYNEQLQELYEREKIYNIPFQYFYGGSFSSGISTYCNADPFFNGDSTQIWFNTTVNTSKLDYYFGMIYNIEILSLKTYGNTINTSNGEFVRIVDLNKKNFNFLMDKIGNVFYYYSIDTMNTGSLNVPALITAYSFDGTELRNKDNIVGIFSNMNTTTAVNNFCNISNSIVYYHTDSTIRFTVLDTLLNPVMHGILDTTTYTPDFYNYGSFTYNLHILDSNHYCILQSIRKDTISGCYPNTDNIIFSTFTQPLVSSIKQKKSYGFLNIFPNPNDGNFTIGFASTGNFPITITLMDVTGKVVYRQTLQHRNESFIQISDAVLPSGMYNVQISSSWDTWNKKIMITK